MASITELLPLPVGPVRAKMSSPPKSISVADRNGANPAISRRSGFMGLLDQVLEQLHDRLVEGVDLVEVLGEQLGMGAPAPLGPLPSLVLPAPGVDHHLD